MAANKIFAARLEEVPALVEYVSGLAQAARLHPKRLMHLQLAVEEAATNICSFDYQIPPGGVTVQVTDEGGRFTVKLVDNGVPFDPVTLDEPDLKAEMEKRDLRGLGILLIRRVMDEVHYQRVNGQNVAILVVYKP